MNVSLVAHAQAAELVQPTDSALDHPAMLSFPLKPGDLTATSQWAKPMVFSAYQHFGLTR